VQVRVSEYAFHQPLAQAHSATRFHDHDIGQITVRREVRDDPGEAELKGPS
jgi:hypothetical protein